VGFKSAEQLIVQQKSVQSINPSGARSCSSRLIGDRRRYLLAAILVPPRVGDSLGDERDFALLVVTHSQFNHAKMEKYSKWRVSWRTELSKRKLTDRIQRPVYK
jgi:hypothetical protein